MSNQPSVRLSNQIITRAQPGQTLWDSEVRGFGLRTTPAGSQSFVFQFRTISGEQGKITVGRYPAMTVDQARKIAREHRVSVDKGGNPSRERQAIRRAATVADYAHIYLKVWAAERALSDGTVSAAKTALDRFVLPHFGSRKIDAILSSDVAAMMAEARDKSGKGQANRVKAVLSKMFNLAIRDQVTSHNPCMGVGAYHIDRRWDHMTQGQVSALLSACDVYCDQNSANVVRLLLFTGARLREVLKAEWGQFDLDRGIWTKPSAHTKQRQIHRLALPPEAVEIVRGMRAESESDRWLFPGKDPRKPRVDFKRPWSALLELAEIGHWRLHDLRRTTATFMLSGGEDITVVGKTLGHTQMQTTLSYASLMPENQRAGLSRAVTTMMGGCTPSS